MIHKTIITFRNDDVRQYLDDSLIKLTEIFVSRKIPITHAVEPANVSIEVVEWLNEMKEQYPEYIEIVQHGYNHKLNYKERIGGKLKKGEFGGKRDYMNQYKDIEDGKRLMNQYFKNKWFQSFTFPYGARNDATLRAINDIGFKVINGSQSPSFAHQTFYFIGRLLRKEYFIKRKVSYNLRYRFNKGLFQIDMGISLINKYIDENNKADFLSLEQLKSETERYSKLPSFGVLFHHRYHNSEEKLKLIENYLNYLIESDKYQFLKQEDILNKFK